MSLTDEQLDALRTEAIRARGFVRGSETQLTKFIDMMDEMRAPTPDPDPDPDPQPDPDPDPDPDPAPDPDPPPPSGDLLFSSDWSGGGQTDGGKWNWNGGNRPGSVVAGGPGSPTPNVLEFDVDAGSYNDTWFQMYASVPEPAIGEKITWRWYMNSMTPDPGYASDHGIAWTSQLILGDNGRPWFTQDSQDANSFRPGYLGSENWYAGQVPKNQWHRYELTFEQISAGQHTVRLTVWDDDDSTVLYGPSDFGYYGQSGRTLATETFSGDWRQHFRHFVGFVGGFDNPASSAHVVGQWAAVACVRGESVGPYDAARGW